MNDSSSAGIASRTPAKKSSNGKDSLNELRSLLVGPEQAQIERLQTRLDQIQVNPENVAEALPDAIGLRVAKDEKLTSALLPTVEKAINISVKKNSRVLADALFPVMGPAIRKAISAAINGMLQSLNQTLQYSISVQGLRWRWEAFRTGKSFAEIVLLHSLRYRVEQVFLIHRSSGLLLQHVTTNTEKGKDADMVSGMLTAIQDFVKDSFHVKEGENLNTMQVGELSVWVEPGPLATVAGVIRGNAPAELRLTFQEAIERIHEEKRKELEVFDGDAETFAGIRPYLESCLQYQYEERKKKTSPVLWIGLAAILILLGAWAFIRIEQNRRWSAYLNELNAQPGIVVTRAIRSGNNYTVAGLRDPLAANPDVALEHSGLPRERVHTQWQPYQALLPQFILARAQKSLQPPESAKLKFQNGILSISGVASHAWIQDTAKLVRVIDGIQKWDTSQLKDSDMQSIQSMKEIVEKTIIRFVRGKADFAEGQEETINDFLSRLSSLDAYAQQAGERYILTVTGHADSEGTEQFNFSLSRQRSERIVRLLWERGLNTAAVRTTGVGASQPVRSETSEDDRQWNRSVSFGIRVANGKSGELP